ncbi:drug/metabolite transporter (DMT)-like permease [Rhodoligotrophos appendicifer]|uniref:DMT family transporter n=1 Tax=Rhodoligotrophos appendicifer TaxID=987056 RepID=UPI001478229D|nr:DMT family transporter [Rhodoligotrophos appendicifer]
MTDLATVKIAGATTTPDTHLVGGLRRSPRKAILFALAAIFCLCVLDVLVKWLAASYSIPQIIFLRYIGGLALALVVAQRSGGFAQLRTNRISGHLTRSLFNLITMLLFYYALRMLPLADVVAIAFAAPLFMTLLSILFLGEKVGPARWLALAIGMVGVIVILRPGDGSLGLGGALALCSALFYALTQISARQLSSTESSATILFYYSAGVLVITMCLLPWNWQMPSLFDWGLFVLLSIFGSYGQLFLNQACRYGEVSMLASIEYTGLFWAVLFGFLVWGDIPTWSVVIGAGIIVASTLFITRREMMRKDIPLRESAG